ncbi:MAG: MFS transporter [Anaerovoracaceae bacterium]
MFGKMMQQYRGLPREIYVLLVARTIAAMGALVYPFLTFFLSDKMNLSEETIAQFLLIVSISSLPASLMGGKLADRFSRKYVYVTVVLISNVFFILAGFLYKELISIAIILIAYFFLNMAMPILSAMMADLTTPENRQESFSLVYLGFNLGYAIGPMLAGLLFENYIQWIFWGQAILSMTAISLIAFFISSKVLKEAKEKDSSICTETSLSAGEDNLLRALIKRPGVLLFACLGMLPAFAYSQMGYVMPLHMSEAFGAWDGSKFYGIIWSLNGLMVAVATPLTVLIFKKMHPLINISVAALLYTIGFGCYAFAEELFVFYLLVIVWSTGEVIIATNSGVFIANNSPVTHRARFQAIYDIIQGTGRAVSPIVMASYITNHTFGECWLLAGGGCLFASLGYALFYLKIRKNGV